MSQLTIIANSRANIDYIEEVRGELIKLVDATRAEAGCVTYDLHEENDDPAHFMIYEIWETRDHWQAHNNSDHLAAFRAAVDGKIVDSVITQLTQIA